MVLIKIPDSVRMRDEDLFINLDQIVSLSEDNCFTTIVINGYSSSIHLRCSLDEFKEFERIEI